MNRLLKAYYKITKKTCVTFFKREFSRDENGNWWEVETLRSLGLSD